MMQKSQQGVLNTGGKKKGHRLRCDAAAQDSPEFELQKSRGTTIKKRKKKKNMEEKTLLPDKV